MAPLPLLGPPELRNATPFPATSAAPPSASDPFMDLLVANFNNTKMAPPLLPMGRTENNSATFLATDNPCLDFFFHVVPGTPPSSITQRLSSAWNHDPLTTLKLTCNLRGVRGTGKSDKEGFYTTALWLHGQHPKTFACNVGPLSDFGYFKDLPEIIYRLLEGREVRQRQKAERLQRKGLKTRRNGSARGPFSMKNRRVIQNRLKRTTKKVRSSMPKEARVQISLERDKKEKEGASKLRKDKKTSMAKKLFDRYNSDPDFRFLYERVSDHFAECLKADLQFMNSGETNKISLAAKWCPSLDSSFDRSTLLCESIARKIFRKESCCEYKDIEEAHYAYRVRDRLRKHVLVPLRKALELPEVYIGANKWNSIPYHRVASVAMKFYKDKFMKHDGERFAEYLAKVKAGKATIAAGALLPHEIIASLNDEDGGEVAELQWKRMVDDLLKIGKMKNCLAVCDVSGSMSGIPMEVSVALGVLLSELSEEPWKGKLITFSKDPKLEIVKGNDLRSKTQFVRRMEWGMNTDFQKVFDLILQVAVQGNLKEDQMIKRVFVLSDMEFDQASSRPWETDYMVITKKFTEKGFGSSVPQIVFWNLRDSKATPVPSTQKGVALVSGYSKNLMKMFLDEEGYISPDAVMEAAISGEEYRKLVVVD